MKKTMILAINLLVLLLLCSCQNEEQNSMQNTNTKTATFINGVTDADVWVLPQTEKNLKTTVWGTATISKIKTDESRQFSLCEPGDDGLYILRMIDTESFYYSADGIALEEGWTLRIEGNDLWSIVVEVLDESGVLQNTYEVFSARL